jgi:hypothetical protein
MTEIDHWTAAAYYNRPVLRKLSLKQRFNRDMILHPFQYRQRRNLWILAAGMLDAARYLNVPTDGSDLHPGFDGNAPERTVWTQLATYIEWNHAEDFRTFRKKYDSVTNNFADVDEIKLILHDVIMRSSEYQHITDPMFLLEAAVGRKLNGFGKVPGENVTL